MSSSKAQPKAASGLLGAIQTGASHAVTDAQLAKDKPREKVVDLVSVELIKDRVADTRKAKADHVLGVAESIAALGLLQPPAVDRKHRLIAGLHRITACRLLLADPAERITMFAQLEGAARIPTDEIKARLGALPSPRDLPEPLVNGRVPVAILTGIDAENDKAAALAAEVAENVTRKKYTTPEIYSLVGQLRSHGYTEPKGRPRVGEKALRPALRLILGMSEKTIRNILEREKGGKLPPFQSKEASPKAEVSLLNAISSYRKAAEKQGTIKPTETLLKSLTELLDDLKKRAGR